MVFQLINNRFAFVDSDVDGDVRSVLIRARHVQDQIKSQTMHLLQR